MGFWGNREGEEKLKLANNKQSQNKNKILACFCKYKILLQCLHSKCWGTGEGKQSGVRQYFHHYYLL